VDRGDVNSGVLRISFEGLEGRPSRDEGGRDEATKASGKSLILAYADGDFQVLLKEPLVRCGMSFWF
jgi:hypothetical protein